MQIYDVLEFLEAVSRSMAKTMMLLTANPTLPRICVISGHKPLDSYHAILGLRKTSLRNLREHAPHGTKLHLNGSWRRMHLTQIPCPIWTMIDGVRHSLPATDHALQIGGMFSLVWREDVMCIDVRRFRERWAERKAEEKRQLRERVSKEIERSRRGLGCHCCCCCRRGDEEGH